MQNLVGTLRYTLRQFRQSPVFTTAAVTDAGLGNRWNHGDFHVDPCGYAPFVACFGPGDVCIASATATIAAWKAARRTGGECIPSRYTSA